MRCAGSKQDLVRFAPKKHLETLATNARLATIGFNANLAYRLSLLAERVGATVQSGLAFGSDRKNQRLFR